jgi:hypothetical protein
VIGPPEGAFNKERYPDVFNAGIGLLWVADSVRRRLEGINVRSVRFHSIHDLLRDQASGYSEIEVERAVLRVDHPGIDSVRCPECGRTPFLEGVPYVVSRQSVGAADIVYLEPGTRLMVVSERVKSVMEEADWLQVSFFPLDVVD